MNGWIKLHRQIASNGLWNSEPFTKGQAWIDLLLFANHKDNSFWIRGVEIPVKRGQLGWSEVTMAQRWTWSRNKVRRFLKLLETKQQIEQQKLAKLTTIITIVNYEQYQGETTDDTTERQQKDNRRYTNKNVKNVKNDKKEKGRFTPPSLLEVQEYITMKSYIVDANEFMSFYESNGWRVGKNKMVSWKGAIGSWQSRKGTAKTTPLEREIAQMKKEHGDNTAWYRLLKKHGEEVMHPLISKFDL